MSWKAVLVRYSPNPSTNGILGTLFGFALPKAKQSQYFLVCMLGVTVCWLREKPGLARNTECQVRGVKKDVPYATLHPDLEGLLEERSAHIFPGMLHLWLAERMTGQEDIFRDISPSMYEHLGSTLGSLQHHVDSQRLSSSCTIDSKTLPVSV